MVNINNKFKLIFTFFCLSLTPGLNIFLMQAINYYRISVNEASNLTFYCTIPGFIASFIMFAIVLKIGYKRTIVFNYLLLLFYYFIIPFVDSIWIIRIQCILSALSFVAVKLVIYSSVGLVARDQKEHASTINLMEAFYSSGGIINLWLVSWFVQEMPKHWIYFFWFYCITSGLLFFIWSISPFDESKIKKEEELPFKDTIKQFKMLFSPIFMVVIVLLLAQDYIEQGVGNWMPFFDHNVIGVQPAIALQVASIGGIATTIGRFIGAFLLRYFKWYKVLMGYMTILIIYIFMMFRLIEPGMAVKAGTIFEVPFVAFTVPITGFLTAPIYPTLVSTLLTAIPKEKHVIVLTLLLILGYVMDTIVVKTTGVLFGGIGGLMAFEIILIISFIVILALSYPFHMLHKKETVKFNDMQFFG